MSSLRFITMKNDERVPDASNSTPAPVAIDDTAPHSASLHDSTDSPMKTIVHKPAWRRLRDKLTWMPPWCRWDPDHPPVFSMPMNVLFGFAGAFTVANLYYSHPILNILADDFHVSNLEVSHIPTLMQYSARSFYAFRVMCSNTSYPGVVMRLDFYSCVRWAIHLNEDLSCY